MTGDNQPSGDGNAKGFGCLVIIAIIVVGAIWGALFGSDDEDPVPGEDPHVDEFTAIGACQNSVEAQLKSPGSAEFGGENAARQAGGRYEISGWVDAQNSFGALVRVTWTCSATPTDTGYRGRATLSE